jgi:hypothetical protein
MNELIYYPTFEVIDPQWLKFALLYIDKLDPIIPEAGDGYLSDEFQQVMGETDLIDIHRPNYGEGFSATRDALENLEKILKHPERYFDVFQPHFIEKWKQPQRQTARLFKDKYTDEWEQFCLKNRLGRPTRTGLLLSEDVALLYMTLLAQVIADSRGVSPITDDPLLDRFAIFTRRQHSADSTSMKTAQAIINLELPAHISNIPLTEIISRRNSEGFKERLRAFHQSLDAFMSNTEQGNTPGRFGESLGNSWNDFREDILKLGLGLTGFTLGVWIALGAGPIGTLKGAQQIVGGLSLAVGSGIAIRNTWNHTESKRFTRKYLADLGKIKLQ